MVSWHEGALSTGFLKPPLLSSAPWGVAVGGCDSPASEAWLSHQAALPSVLAQNGQEHQHWQGGHRAPSLAGMGVTLLPCDHQVFNLPLLSPQGSGFRLGPHQRCWLGGGSEATRLQAALGAAPMAPGKQKVRGPRRSYLAPPPGEGEGA